MRDKPESCFSSGCPLATTCQCGHHVDLHPDDSACGHVDPDTGARSCNCNVFRSKGRGFVLGVGDPATAKYAAIFEAPGREEIAFSLHPVSGRGFLETQAQVNEELGRRKKRYEGIPEKLLRLGAPVVGPTGMALMMWVFPKLGIKREEFFLDNTIRCLPPKGSKGYYPTGDEKKSAERCCRQYDRLDEFRPDIAIATLHPAGILREITPLPLLIKDMEKVRDFSQAGKRTMALLGGKAVQAFLRYGENVTKWRGHYVRLKEDWIQTYKQLFEFRAKVKKSRAKAGRSDNPKPVAVPARSDGASFAQVDAIFDLAPEIKLMRGKKLRKKTEVEI